MKAGNSLAVNKTAALVTAQKKKNYRLVFEKKDFVDCPWLWHEETLRYAKGAITAARETPTQFILEFANEQRMQANYERNKTFDIIADRRYS